MGYSPQLLGGVWIGCDDRFIRIENNLGYGGRAAMPIWEKFFQKVYADKTLGIDKDARFVQPADIQLHINSADDIPTTEQVEPGAEGVDQGVGEATDYNVHEYIGPESKPVVDEDKPVKKDTSGKKEEKKNVTDSKPIGSAEEQPKKKGFFKRLFGKKEKKD
jgi:penicillin-binding protein 1A